MHNSFFNALDYFYLLLLFISCMLGFFKGFIKDFFSTCSWLGSGFFTALIAPYCSIYLKNNEIVSNPTLSKIIATLLCFFLILIVLRMIINSFSSHVKNSTFSGIDRALGAFYGFVRGLMLLLIICSAVSMFNIFDPQNKFTSKSKITTHLINIANNLIPKLYQVSNFKAHSYVPKSKKTITLETKLFSERKIEPYKTFRSTKKENKRNLLRHLFDHIKTTSYHFFNTPLFPTHNTYRNRSKRSVSATLLNSKKMKRSKSFQK